MPISSVNVGTSNKALNKIAWDRHQGRRVACGSSDGLLYIYDIGDQALPRENEWTEMQKTLQGMGIGKGTM